MAESPTHLLLSTRKGLLVYKRTLHGWVFDQVHFLGIPVTLTYVDPALGAWWACLDHGHWGVKLHRSPDQGATWEEINAPKYPEGAEVQPGEQAVLNYIWAMQGTEQGDLWVGTIPGGLFKYHPETADFHLVESLWKHPSRPDNWFGGGFDQPGIHSIVVDPRDPQHVYVGISVAGVFESSDGGISWEPRNQGLRADFLPNPDAEVGHDPHMLVACAAQPEVMWQQNHCGIFKTTDGGHSWVDVSETEGPARFGFAMAVAATDPDKAWVVPALSDEMRIAIDQALCVCRTTNGGHSWEKLRKGLPQQQCFDIVYRHSLDVCGHTLCFGSTTGNVYISEDEGDQWQLLSHTLPMVHAVELARL